MTGPVPDSARLKRNSTCIRVMNFTWMFMLMMPVAVPYMKSFGLNREQIFQVQAFFGLVIVVLEVPSGYVSDLFGRRGCLLMASVIRGAAYIWLAFVNSFTDMLIFQFLAAMSVALYSGTDVAILYDSLEAAGKSGSQRREMSQRLFWMQTGETSAAVLATLIMAGAVKVGDEPLRAVAFWNAIVGGVPFVAALFLVEPPRPRMSKTNHFENLRFVAHKLWQQGPMMRRVLVGLVAYGLTTLLAVWSFQDYWEELGIGLTSFGVLWAAYNMIVALVGRSAHRIETFFGTPHTIRIIGILPVIGFAGMAVCAGAPNFVVLSLGVAAGFAFQIGRGLTQVVLKDELNHRVPTEMRATANSISSLGVRLAFIPLGPLLGSLVDDWGHGVAYGIFAGGCVLVLLVIALPLARDLGREQRA
jgi:MFS family permease